MLSTLKGKFFIYVFRDKIRSDSDKIGVAKKEFVDYQKECIRNINSKKQKWKNSLKLKNKEKYKNTDEFTLNISGKGQIKVTRGLLTKVRILN